MIKALKKIFSKKEASKETALKEAYVRNFARGGPWSSLSRGAVGEDLSLSELRDKARAEEKNNDIIRKYLSLLPNNVIGPQGFRLECRFKDESGKLLERENRIIEEGWKKWCEAGSPEASGRFSFTEVCRLALTSVARDGDFFARKVYGNFNSCGFAIDLLDSELCDDDLNQEKPKIVMGVEIDRWRRPVAYHFKSKDKDIKSQKSVRYSAKDMVHLFRSERVQQVRGLSWIRSENIAKLKRYYDAELQAARVSSSKMGFFKKKADGYVEELSASIDGKGQGTDYDAFPMDAIPGAFEILPEGWELQEWSPNSPQSNFSDFVKSQMLQISGGLGVSYGSLSSDLSNANYSSIRTGMLEERTHFNSLQRWFSDHFIIPIYRAWLSHAALQGQIDIKVSDLKKFSTPLLQGKVHEWIDPLRCKELRT